MFLINELNKYKIHVTNTLQFKKSDKIKTGYNSLTFPVFWVKFPQFSSTWDKVSLPVGTFSIHFWRQYVSLFTSIATIVVPIADFQ